MQKEIYNIKNVCTREIKKNIIRPDEKKKQVAWIMTVS